MFKWIVKRDLKNLNRQLKNDLLKYVRFKITFKTCTGDVIEHITNRYYYVKTNFVDEYKYVKIGKKEYPISSMEWIEFEPIGDEVSIYFYNGCKRINESQIKRETELRNYHIERCNKYGVDCIFGKELIL